VVADSKLSMTLSEAAKDLQPGTAAQWVATDFEEGWS
jgi:hypothetical protein